MTASAAASFYDVLEERGLVAQCTDEEVRKRLATPQVAYVGFDPTADSLHVGSLVPILGLAHLQRCGHKPLVVVGGATGLVGDPSGKTEARKMLTKEDIAHNAEAIGAQIGRFLTFGDGPTDAVLLNNIDWLESLNWIEMLRTVGPHFSVNRMLTMDSVKGRMDAEGGGISFLEFNYMVMQAYDFAYLSQTHGCTMQLGGQDQWGNIVMGIELGRRLHGVSLAGLTQPLVTKADGGKFGKSEQGNVWLDAARTSPFDFYQFWRNVSDDDVGRYLGYFTFLPMDEVRDLAGREGQTINDSKERLAFEVTTLVHGEEQAQRARDSAKRAFAGADVTGDSIPHAPLPRAELESGVGLLSLMVRGELAKSNGEARRLVEGGGVRVHDTKVTDPKHQVGADAEQDGYVLIRAGKKRMFRFDVE